VKEVNNMSRKGRVLCLIVILVLSGCFNNKKEPIFDVENHLERYAFNAEKYPEYFKEYKELTENLTYEVLNIRAKNISYLLKADNFSFAVSNGNTIINRTEDITLAIKTVRYKIVDFEENVIGDIMIKDGEDIRLYGPLFGGSEEEVIKLVNQGDIDIDVIKIFDKYNINTGTDLMLEMLKNIDMKVDSTSSIEEIEANYLFKVLTMIYMPESEHIYILKGHVNGTFIKTKRGLGILEIFRNGKRYSILYRPEYAKKIDKEYVINLASSIKFD
jgi:hypothetical protein